MRNGKSNYIKIFPVSRNLDFILLAKNHLTEYIVDFFLFFNEIAKFQSHKGLLYVIYELTFFTYYVILRVTKRKEGAVYEADQTGS